MDENTSLINIGELSRPATVLIEKISYAVGGIFKPYQIVRVAKAEAQADRVRAEGQIEISDLQRRAFHRFLNEQAKKQENIEDITQKALPLLEENSEPNEIEDDWLTNFFDRCRLISDEEMQHLWARVLAGEANAPGKYSRRTLSFLSALDKSEADMFTRLCGFVWEIGAPIPLVLTRFDYGQQEVYETQGIDERLLKDLETIGLIQLTDGEFVTPFPKEPISYYGEQLVLECVDPSRHELPVGRVQLTKVGEELAGICGAKRVGRFFDMMIRHWKGYRWMQVLEMWELRYRDSRNT
jgi:hypothetical protein